MVVCRPSFTILLLTSRAGPQGAWKQNGRKERRQDGGTAIKSTVRHDPATSGRGGEQHGLPNRRSDTRVSTRASGGHTRIEALSGNFCNDILLFKSRRATLTKSRFHALRRMSATHIGAHRTRQSNERWRSAWTHPEAYFIRLFTTHVKAATTVGLRDRCFSLHPTVVLNAFLWNKWPADDAAGGWSIWAVVAGGR